MFNKTKAWISKQIKGDIYEELGIKLPKCLTCGSLCEAGLYCSDYCYLKRNKELDV